MPASLDEALDILKRQEPELRARRDAEAAAAPQHLREALSAF